LVLAFDTATIISPEAFASFYTTVYSILPSIAGGLSLAIIGTTEEADNIVLADYIIYNLDGAIPASYLQENRIHEVAEASVP
jgi:hypothetical protein